MCRRLREAVRQRSPEDVRVLRPSAQGRAVWLQGEHTLHVGESGKMVSLTEGRMLDEEDEDGREITPIFVIRQQSRKNVAVKLCRYVIKHVI